jgi:hypothetical protein
MTVVGLGDSETWYFAVRAQDDGGNLSGLSNSPSATTASGDGGGGDGGGDDGSGSEDTVPPGTPFGLIVGSYSDVTGVTLLWESNSEPDLAGYNVYRRAVSAAREPSEDWSTVNSSVLGDASFTDTSVREGQTYEYAITALDEQDNESGQSGVVLFDPALWVRGNLLMPNRPNPFTTSAGTLVSFRAPTASPGTTYRATLTVFDVGGRVVRTLFDGPLAAGEARSVPWNGRDASGREVSAGVYFSRLDIAGVDSTTEKMVVLR